MSVVNVLEYPSPEINRREIRRYMSCGEINDRTEELIDRCLEESKNSFCYRVAYCELPVIRNGHIISMGELTVNSRDMEKNLSGCSKAIVFASTVGLGIDRLIRKYSHSSPSTALCMQAIGAERIESLCNCFCNDIKEKYAPQGSALRPRFSPGYGDMTLSYQKDIFKLLECEKHIGLTLNDSLLMSPSKSVTAIIGIKENTKH